VLYTGMLLRSSEERRLSVSVWEGLKQPEGQTYHVRGLIE
jgi:hypothetical protein